MSQKQFVVQSACSDDILEDDLLITTVIQEENLASPLKARNLLVTLKDLFWLVDNQPFVFSIAKSNSLVVGSTLVIPCSANTMNEFLLGKISEREIFDLMLTSEVQYDSLYLASAAFLPEAREHQLIIQCFLQSIQAIQSQHPALHSIFYWSGSPTTQIIDESMAKQLATDNLNLFKK